MKKYLFLYWNITLTRCGNAWSSKMGVKWRSPTIIQKFLLHCSTTQKSFHLFACALTLSTMIAGRNDLNVTFGHHFAPPIPHQILGSCEHFFKNANSLQGPQFKARAFSQRRSRANHCPFVTWIFSPFL